MDRSDVQHVTVEYYGHSDVPLNQVAAIDVDPLTGALLVTPWEKPMVKAVAEALREQVDGVDVVEPNVFDWERGRIVVKTKEVAR